MGRLTFSIAAFSFLFAASMASAADKPEPDNPVAAQPHLQDDQDCDCLAQGKRWRQGEQICMNGLVHTCGMDQNVPLWFPNGETCRVSDASPPDPKRRLTLPAFRRL